MGWFKRTFQNTPEARIERATLFIDRKDYNNARLELDGLDQTEAQNMLNKALMGLVELNLKEAEARFSADDNEGAMEHLKLAKNFGASSDQIRTIQKIGGEYQQERRMEAMQRNAAKSKVEPHGDDPIWGLPPDDPRLQYAIHLEGYPVALRERLIPLGQEFAQAVLQIDQGNPQLSLETINNFIEKEPATRYERSRAALAIGNFPLAMSDLLIFGEELGHQEINNVHTGALLGQLFAQTGRGMEGIEKLNKIISNDSHPSLRIVRAQLLEHSGDLVKAEKEVQELLKDHPSSQPLIRQLAQIRMKLGNRISAANTLEAGFASCCATGTCSSQPPNIGALRLLARIYLEDRVMPERVTDLLQQLSGKVQQPQWEDHYLVALQARNEGSPFLKDMTTKLFSSLKDGDPRQTRVKESFQEIFST
jgi:hypothetical protein